MLKVHERGVCVIHIPDSATLAEAAWLALIEPFWWFSLLRCVSLGSMEAVGDLCGPTCVSMCEVTRTRAALYASLYILTCPLRSCMNEVCIQDGSVQLDRPCAMTSGCSPRNSGPAE